MASVESHSGPICDVVIPLPAEDVERSVGLALAIGCTTGKLIYRSKKDYKDGKPINNQDESQKGQVHYAFFPEGCLDSMIKYIREKVDLTADENGRITVNSTGVETEDLRTKIESELKCKLVIHSELACFVKGFQAQEKILSPEELFEPLPPDVMEDIERVTVPYWQALDKFQSMSEIKVFQDSPKSNVEEETRNAEKPRILVLAGSGTQICQLNPDGSSSILAVQTIGGQFVHGLAGFLTGEKDFKQLEQLAEDGDGKSVDHLFSDNTTKRPSSEKNVYDGVSQVEHSQFPFGKGNMLDKGDVKRPDLVHSAFYVAAVSHAVSIYYQCQLTGTKDVIFCGNLFSPRIMRKMLVLEKLLIEAQKNMEGEPVLYHFMKNDGMLGVLGAFLHRNTLE